MKTIKQTLITLVICIIVLAGVNMIYAWSDPGCDPPNCNVSAPINVSNIAQQKIGALRVGGLTSDYSSYLATISGNVGIGTTNTGGTKLKVIGDIRADVYKGDSAGNVIIQLGN